MNQPGGGCASAATWNNWKSINWIKVERDVKSLQSRIVKAVKAKHFHKAKALMHLITRSFYGKLLAILRVTTNKGSKTAGVDNILWDTPLKRWKAIEQLKVKGYKAKPLKRSSIKKKNGKLRHLGIPTICDRAHQALHKLALEPMAETLSDPNSYGFRPKRSCADAVVQCHLLLCKRSSPQWILEGDIKGCFDNISHQWILQHIPINDKVLTQWLKAGYIDKKQWFPTDTGTPQGGIASPLIANMVLDGLEYVIMRYACPKPYRNPNHVHFIRYADDFVVTCKNREYLEAEIKPVIIKFLAERGLELSPEKTLITNIRDGFDFLGFNIRKYKHKCLTKPKKDSVLSVYSKMNDVVNSYSSKSQLELILKLSPIIRGWSNFFRHSAAKRTFSLLDHKLFFLLWKWAYRRHPNKGKHWIKNKYFRSMGYRHWVFADTDNKISVIELPSFAATKIIRHVKIKNESNPYDKDWYEYFRTRENKRLDKRSIISKQANVA
jgi:RNA-directed DNA polymerase